MAQDDAMAQEDSSLQRKAVPMAQEGCRYGIGGYPHGTGGLSLWHRRAVAMAQEGIPMAQKDIPMAQYKSQR
jgi:hypothetical protein